MIEYKTQPLEACELKFNDDDWRVEGYASVWDSTDLAGDTVVRGAFTKSLESGLPLMRYEHLRYATPGKWSEAVEDEKGLRVSGHLTRDHSVAKDLRASMRHGTIRGLSIGFNVEPNGAEEKADGGRVLKRLNLVEVSFTATPCEPQAVVTAFKSEVGAIQTLGDMEDFLREVGNLSKSMATYLVSHMKSICRSESAQKDLEEMKHRMQVQELLNRYDLRKLIHEASK